MQPVQISNIDHGIANDYVISLVKNVVFVDSGSSEQQSLTWTLENGKYTIMKREWIIICKHKHSINEWKRWEFRGLKCIHLLKKKA